MRSLLRKWDFLIFALIAACFAYVAAQKLGNVPAPQTDESYTLQVPYEMLNRGKLALPMFRYLGGNIENVWHSYTPVYFVALAGFFKLYGWGLLEGRAFNLITAVLTLLMVYLIGRRLFDWRAGIVAVVVLFSDPVFFERGRLLRNDFAAAALAMLAFYLFEIAEERKRLWLYVASGVAAGAGVMCHTNILYMLGVIGLLMLMKRGWQMFKARETCLFAAGATAVMAYEIVYVLIDYQNFRLQNRDDRLHFHVFSLDGLQRNVIKEGYRYRDWFVGGTMFPSLPRNLLYIFFGLAAAAVVYLVVRGIRFVKRGEAHDQPRVHVLVATLGVAVFLAVVSGNKELYYIAHLAPWFALCAGILVSDLLALIPRLRAAKWPRARAVYAAALVVVALTTFAYGRALVRQNKRYLRQVQNPDLVNFEEVKSVLREIVPEGTCPVAMKSPVMWLAFPEEDRCFASIEERMKDAVDIDGKDYSVILPNAKLNARGVWKSELEEKYRLLGELRNSVYGDVLVYYAGVDPRYLATPPQIYYFFGERRGHYTDEQLVRAPEVWAIGPGGESPSNQGLVVQSPPGARGVTLVELGSVELKPDTLYQAGLDVRAVVSKWELVVLDMRTGDWIAQVELGLGGAQRTGTLFRTTTTSLVRLALRPVEPGSATPVTISRAAIREVTSLWPKQ
jgi:4-amino-4-deoxy-L-arabinose transferase-like glycosyltransferase